MYIAPTVVQTELAAFPWVIQGSRERALAHVAILDAICEGDSKALREWLDRDLSLFVERVTADIGDAAAGPQMPGGRVIWEGSVDRYGSWAMRSALMGPQSLTLELLRRGVHPDDAVVFNGSPLLHRLEWLCAPELLKAALEAGATVSADDSPRGYLRAVLVECARVLSRGSENDLGRALECVESAKLLLDAGDRGFDPAPTPDGRASGVVAILAGKWGQWPADAAHEPLVSQLTALIARLVELGADIDEPSGGDMLPPVVTAVRSENMLAAQLLVALGARTDDHHVVRLAGAGLQRVGSLLEEAENHGGTEFKARMAEALMRRGIVREQGAIKAEVATAAPGRRRAAL